MAASLEAGWKERLGVGRRLLTAFVEVSALSDAYEEDDTERPPVKRD